MLQPNRYKLGSELGAHTWFIKRMFLRVEVGPRDGAKAGTLGPGLGES